MTDPSPKPRTPDPEASARQRQIVLILSGILLTTVLILVVLVFNRPAADRPGAADSVAPPSTNQAASAKPAPLTRPAPSNRSPIPAPGETITSPFPARRLDTPDASSTTSSEPSRATAFPEAPAEIPAGQIVPWHQAPQFVGRTITVEGKVIDTHNTGTVCFLNFSNDRDTFYVILFEEVLGAWPQPPQDWFLNKTVRVTGQVYMQKGRPQIRVKNAGQITVMP